jgi:hypothetical protein
MAGGPDVSYRQDKAKANPDQAAYWNRGRSPVLMAIVK